MTTPKAKLKLWQVFYITHDGVFGEIAYIPLFKTKEKAEAWAEGFKAEHSYVRETLVRHPTEVYSAY